VKGFVKSTATVDQVRPLGISASSGGAASPPEPQQPEQPVQAAFAELFTAHYPRIQAYARRRLADPETARDTAAEVFHLAWQRCCTEAPTDPITPGWLFVTARNLIANHQRRAAENGQLWTAIVGEASRRAGGGAVEGPEAALGGLTGRVGQALDAIAPAQAEILTAHYWDGLSGAECAALFDCSIPAVWMRLNRARAAFRHAYTNQEDPK
jgi:RNA polymerase sigma-70 factor (ECF subfamily)